MQRFLVAALLVTSGLHAQQIVGPTISAGTWTKEAGPYIVPGDATLASGTLLIEAGTEIVLGGNDPDVEGSVGVTLSFAPGVVDARGTADEPIVFRTPSPDVDNVRFRRVYVGNSESSFRHCQFINADHGLYLHAGGATIRPLVANCTFRNCSGAGIYGDSEGRLSSGFPVFPREAALHPVIRNCVFEDSARGCFFRLRGTTHQLVMGRLFSRGAANPTITNNLFRGMSLAAVELSIQPQLANASAPRLSNNTFVDCEVGLIAINPFDCAVRGNIFYRTPTGVSRTGNLSQTNLSHNCFYPQENPQDAFVGYPVSFGNVVWDNERGVPADLSFNIFEDPMFEDEVSFALSCDSPCVDSSCTTNNCNPTIYNDVCSPPSCGSSVGDLGIFGGPWACEMIPSSDVDTPFLRSDVNSSGNIEISDAIGVLTFLFTADGPDTTCAKAMDADDNSFVEITDGVFILRYLFIGGIQPPAPFNACGPDPSRDPLPCTSYPGCV
ncbi:MAG: right-handed parallel beta-helix repeat-containing protein [Planctomycetota bacterium]